MILLLLILLAPVPKHKPMEPEPELKITQASVIGKWKYEYDTLHDGWIEFFKDGTYESSHTDTDCFSHYGRYTVEGNKITLTEYIGGFGPTLYVFTLDLKMWPNPSGKSNGKIHVKLRTHKWDR